MATTTAESGGVAPLPISSDRWTRYSATVRAMCILGWAFDIYEATIMQLVTPIGPDAQGAHRFRRPEGGLSPARIDS